MALRLNDEQDAMLKGHRGEAMTLAMKAIVQYGNAFGAKRLVPIKSAHLAGTFRASIFKAYYQVLRRLVRADARVSVPTTLNPRPGEQLNILNKLVFRKQRELDEQMASFGVTPNYSCVCYDGVNVPQKGDVLAWAESSAVQYANSVLGARTNRCSVLMDICCALTGLTPEFGYLLDDNRVARLLVKLEIDKMDASALGYLIGRKAVNRVPIIEHHEFTQTELKNMGGSMAAAGGVAMFHVEGLTPEAPDIKTACGGEPPEMMTIRQSDLDDLRTKKRQDSGMVVFGCPQMTLDEAVALSENFIGKKVKVPTWFCLIPEAKRNFRRHSYYEKILAAGVEVHDFCPLPALSVTAKRRKILTPSGKLFYYLDESRFGNIADCLEHCGVS